MNKFLGKLNQLIGFSHLGDKYQYGMDDRFGWMSKEKIPDKWVKTTCGYCSVGCGMLVGLKDDKLVSIKGDPDHLANYGKLCPKGLSEHQSPYSSDRALYPLLRHKNKHTKVSWDEATNVMLQKFAEIQKKYGKGSIGVISTGQMVTEEYYTLGKLVQLGLKTKNYDGNTTLCMSTAVAGYKRSFGSDGPPGAYDDLLKSNCIILIGANIAENHPILTSWIAENKNKKVVVIDPRITKTSIMADYYLPIKPRTDIILLNGIMNILIQEQLIDRAYIKKNTEGYASIVNGLEKFTLQYVSEETGLDIDLIKEVALLYGKSTSAFIAWTMGVNHSDQGTETVNAINNLALMTGNIGKVGSAPFSITGQCNAMGTREASCTSSLPGYRSFEDEVHRKEIAQFWNVSPDSLPTSRGLAYPDIIEKVVQGKIKGLWIIATNPVVSYPNQGFLEDALSRLDFLVVQDGFHPTPTTEIADLVLPTALWGEKEGTYTNSERRVSKVNKIISPPGEAKSDFDIFLLLANKLGVKDFLYPGWKTVEDAFNEWKQVSKGRLCDYSGLTYDLIENTGGVQWPFPENDLEGEELLNEARKTRRLYTDGVFQHPNGKAKFFNVENKPMPENVNEEFPFILNTGRTVQHWHTRTKTGGIPILNRLSPEAWVEMNPKDAYGLGFKQDEKIKIKSRRGEINRITLRITETIGPGQVFIPFHWHEKSANNLTINAFDPFSREPNFKQCAVRIEKLERV